MITFLGLEHMVDATQHAKAGVGWGQVFSYRAKRTSFWIKFLNTTGKVFESNRQSFRIQPEKFPNPPGKVSEDKFPNPTGKVSESNRKVSEDKFPNPTGKVSESTRKSFRIQPEKFPNPTGKVSEDKFPNPTGKVSESNRKSFRIQPEKFPNPPGKVSEYKFPNTTGKVSEDNGLVTESQLPEYKSYRIQPEKFPNPTGKFPNPPGKVSESNRKVSEYKFPNPTRKVSEYNGDPTYVYQSVTLQICQHPPLGSTDLQTKEDQLPATTTAATRTTTTPRTGNSSKLRLQSSVTCVWINFYHHGEGLPKITNLQTHPANPGPVMWGCVHGAVSWQ